MKYINFKEPFFMDKFLRKITPEVDMLVGRKRTSEAIYALEDTISWSLVQLGLIWCDNFTDMAKAQEYLRMAIKVKPGMWQFHINMAHVLNLSFKLEEAKEEALKSVYYSEGRIYDPYYNLGVILANLGDHKNAIEAYRTAIKLNDNKSCLANYNISASYLILKEWEEGWKAYECRLDVFEKIRSIKNRFKNFFKKGLPSKGKKIYIYSEQGVGDLIQFARFIPKFKSLTGATLILEPQIAISQLLEYNKDSLKIDQLVPRKDGIWPEVPEDIDYAVSICSLPGILKAGIKSIPNKNYIKIPKRDVPDVIKNCKDFKIGICWSGNPDHANDPKRSIHLNKFSALFKLDNVQLFSFQKECPLRNWFGKSVNLLANLPQCNIIDLAPEFKDYNDTAFYINQMDLIITIDTSIAHLAGAMGKPMWLLTDKNNDWRWGLEGDKTPWYPSMRLFRQSKLFEWEPVLEEVAKEVKQLVACRNQQ